jgi:hypothetical protein
MEQSLADLTRQLSLQSTQLVRQEQCAEEARR